MANYARVGGQPALAATETAAMANDAGVGGETALTAAGSATMANDGGVGDDAGAQTSTRDWQKGRRWPTSGVDTVVSASKPWRPG